MSARRHQCTGHRPLVKKLLPCGMSSGHGLSRDDRVNGPDRPARRPPNWRAVLSVVAALALVSLGSLIGSHHARPGVQAALVAGATSADRITSAAVLAPPVTSRGIPNASATVTSTADATDAGAAVEAANPLVLFAHGTGGGHTRAFTTTTTTFQVAYTYSCTPTQVAGRFVATLLRNGGSVGAVADGAGRSGQDDHYLGSGRGTFSVAVATSCTWTIAVVDSAGGEDRSSGRRGSSARRPVSRSGGAGGRWLDARSTWDPRA